MCIVVYNDLLYFRSITCGISCFISDFIYFESSLFVRSLTNRLSILSIFSKNQLFVLISLLFVLIPILNISVPISLIYLFCQLQVYWDWLDLGSTEAWGCKDWSYIGVGLKPGSV